MSYRYAKKIRNAFPMDNSLSSVSSNTFSTSGLQLQLQFHSFLAEYSFVPLYSKILVTFDQHTKFMIMKDFPSLKDCRHFAQRCAPFVVAINELNSALFQLGWLSPYEANNFKQIYTSRPKSSWILCLGLSLLKCGNSSSLFWLKSCRIRS